MAKMSFQAKNEIMDSAVTQAIVNKYDKWRKAHYFIWWFFFLGAIFYWSICNGPLWLMAFGFFGLSNHIFLNQIWWKLRSMEYHYDEVLKHDNQTQ